MSTKNQNQNLNLTGVECQDKKGKHLCDAKADKTVSSGVKKTKTPSKTINIELAFVPGTPLWSAPEIIRAMSRGGGRQPE